MNSVYLLCFVVNESEMKLFFKYKVKVVLLKVTEEIYTQIFIFRNKLVNLLICGGNFFYNYRVNLR